MPTFIIMEMQVYKASIDPDPNSDLEVNFIGLVDRPAIERNFQVFKQAPARFAINEEKRVISGPLMIADLPIYRKDEELGEYLVVFGKDDIRAISEKFASKGYMKNFNLFHNASDTVTDVCIFNSFVTDCEIGICAPKGFEDVSDGSWFISVKVNNDDTWGRVKSGDIKGFSVEGLFSYVPVAKVKMTSKALALKIQGILNQTIIED